MIRIALAVRSDEEAKTSEQTWYSENFAAIRERSEALGLPLQDFTRNRVLATRRLAHKLVSEHPEVGPNERVVLDCTDIEVISTPYVDELLHAWPRAAWVHTNRDVQETIDLVRDRKNLPDD